MRQVIADLRKLLGRLERLTNERQPLDVAILDLLSDGSEMSGLSIASVIRRRVPDVKNTLRLLEAAGKLRRKDGRWSLIDEPR
jgi:hypothetical protein